MKNELRQGGFTLIEIMISILLLAITLTGGMALYHNAEQIMALMVHKRVAMVLANKKMEEVRNTKFVILPDDGGEVTESDLQIMGLSATRKTYFSDTASNLKEVRVQVNWHEAGQQHPKTIELVSYVAK